MLIRLIWKVMVSLGVGMLALHLLLAVLGSFISISLGLVAWVVLPVAVVYYRWSGRNNKIKKVERD